jgi:glycosyltransferase involved in cell wall biosynthesis
MLNIIYDATLITNYFHKNSARSGIFFVAYNILLELQRRKDIRLILYIDPQKTGEALKLKNKLFPNLEYIHNYSKNRMLAVINLWLWEIHSKIYNHKWLRKPFALGIVLTQILLKKFSSKKLNNAILSQKCVYLSPAQKVPNFIKERNITSYIFLHDAIPYIFPQINSVKWILEGVFDSKENNFFCNSIQTFNDLRKINSCLNKKNTEVVYLAANSNFKPCVSAELSRCVKNKYHIPSKKYIFTLCTIEPRKNLIRAIRSFITFIEKHKIEDIIWVMGGGHWDSFIKELEKNRVVWDSKYIIQAGYIDDEDLPVLYSNAEWFVYTSQYEGFGLPPLEAMQCGCPVITSNNSSLPEVVGDAGIMIDWDSDEQHVEAYEQYYFNEDLRKENSRKGLERAKLFSWKKTVDKMVETMKNTISS